MRTAPATYGVRDALTTRPLAPTRGALPRRPVPSTATAPAVRADRTVRAVLPDRPPGRLRRRRARSDRPDGPPL